MTVLPAIGATIRRAIERGDYFRRPRGRLSDALEHKEWMHFCVSSEDVDVFVNFSVVDEHRPERDGIVEVGRLTCAVRTSQWDGDVDRFEPEEFSVRAGRMNVRFGESGIAYEGGTFHVLARLRRRPVEVNLTFEPVTVASQVNNISLGDAPPLHWFVVPRLLASGHVRVGNVVTDLARVPAYHDHNWGHFRWGQDFAWVWGYGHGARNAPWSIAFDRLTNRARNEDLLRGILLWHGARHHRVFGGPEIQLRYEGHCRPEHLLKLPRVMGLLRPEMATDVPARLLARAESRGDVLEVEFSARHVCQLIAPNDAGLGVTVINEVSGDLLLSGRVRGQSVDMAGRAMFEFLGG
jgi:hypothetical protein